MRRYEALEEIMQVIGDTPVVCNIGHPSQELYIIKERPENFYMLGSMGLALPIGLGLAMNTDKKILVIDGDAAMTMNMGAFATTGAISPSNLVHGTDGSWLVVIKTETGMPDGVKPIPMSGVEVKERFVGRL